MAKFKDPGLEDRQAAAAAAREKALAKLKSKPPVDPAIVAERIAAREAREAIEAEKRAAKKAEREAAEAERKAAREAAAQAAAEAEAAAAAEAAAKVKPPKPVLSEEEKKAIRDARYAARKQRKGR